VLADPPASDTAAMLRNFAVPLVAALFIARLCGWHMRATVGDLLLMVWLLAAVRQRDTARAEVAALRRGGV
jgi:hypothetical protein